MYRPRATTAGSVTVLLLLMAGCSDDRTASKPTTSEPGKEATSSTPSTPSDRNTSGPPRVDRVDATELEPGSYALPPLGPVHNPVAIVDIPDGYTHWGPFLNAAEPQESEDPLAISLWVITGVYRNACTAGAELPVGDSVRTLAAALDRQQVTTATKPRPVTMAGYDGLYLELAAPTNRRFLGCDDAELNFWDSAPAGSRWTRMPGMVDRLWILDIDEQPMVLAMFVPPSATAEQIDRMEAILRAARFVDL